MQSGLANNVSAADPVSEDAQQQPASKHDSDQQQGDVCAICAVVALANAMLFATPPLLLLPQAIEILYLSTDAEFAHLNSARVAFQPRAPPPSPDIDSSMTPVGFAMSCVADPSGGKLQSDRRASTARAFRIR
jgi:hypothetical protein